MTAAPPAHPVPALPAFVRAQGRLAARFGVTGRGTQVLALHEAGGYRIKFPRVGVCEAVMINTGGGLAGGDRLDIALTADAGATVVATTQSAEKIYRSDGAEGEIETSLNLAAGARLVWAPQETILFSGARLRRQLDATLASDAILTLAETVVFGRIAHDETLGDGLFEDRWQIRRDGRLIFAEAVRLDGVLAERLARPAIGAGARAVATIVHVAPQAERLLEPLREILAAARSDCGASAWNGLLTVRFADADPAVLRRDVAAVLAQIEDRALPRVWQC